MSMQAKFYYPEQVEMTHAANQTKRSKPAESTESYQALLLNTAEHLATRLCRDAIWHGELCNWVGPSMECIEGQWKAVEKNLGPDLYSGTAGIALFLTEFYTQRPLLSVKQTAEAALRHAVNNMHKMLDSTRAGYYCGLLGVADVALRCEEAFDQSDWSHVASRLIDELVQIGPNAHGIDVIMGSAGAIPALIGLYQRTGNEALLDLANKHANQLLEIAVHQPQGCSWDTLNTGDQHSHLTGYAHGTAGVALAFAEIYRTTGEARYKDAAIAGFAYEESKFDSEQQNWPDFRDLELQGISADQKVCAVAWCHGSAGIGITRLRAQSILGSEKLCAEANTAVTTTRRQLDNYLQHNGFDFTYCHGVIGDLELLLQADDYIGTNQHRDYIYQVLQWAIHTYETTEQKWPCGVPEAGESPSLFLGTAGIGHFMLRASMPKVVSSVLTPSSCTDGHVGRQAR